MRSRSRYRPRVTFGDILCVFRQSNQSYRELRMRAFEDIKPGARLRGLDQGIAEVVQFARFGPDALNLVFRVDGRVGERLVYRGEESGFYLHTVGLAPPRTAPTAYRILRISPYPVSVRALCA